MQQDLFPPENSESLLWGEDFTRGERGGRWGRAEEPDLRPAGAGWPLN